MTRRWARWRWTPRRGGRSRRVSEENHLHDKRQRRRRASTGGSTIACLFKTRSEAQNACKGGKVEVNRQAARPNRALRPGDEVANHPRGRTPQILVVRGFAAATSRRPRRALSTRTSPLRPRPKNWRRGVCCVRSARGPLRARHHTPEARGAAPQRGRLGLSRPSLSDAECRPRPAGIWPRS